MRQLQLQYFVMGLKLLEMNKYMFHVEFSLGGHHKRILLPTGSWEPGQTDQNGSYPQQSCTESTYSWHLFQQICLQVSYQTDNISQLETRSINYIHGCLHTGLVHNAGQVICQPTLDMIGRVLSQVCQQSVQELVLVAPVWRAQVWNPTLLQIRSEVIMLE